MRPDRPRRHKHFDYGCVTGAGGVAVTSQLQLPGCDCGRQPVLRWHWVPDALWDPHDHYRQVMTTSIRSILQQYLVTQAVSPCTAMPH